MSNPQQPPPWPKTKLVFYIWWIFLTAIPSILSLASLSDVLKPPPGDDRNQHKEKPRLIECVLFLSVLVSNLTLLYYLSIKLRAHRSRSRGVLESPAVAAEQFIMTERKGAAILLVAATAWVPAVGGMVLMMLMATIVVGSSFLDVAVVVGMPSLIGHLLYVWGKSLRIVVMGSRKTVAGEEEGDEEAGEMLLPFGGEERV